MTPNTIPTQVVVDYSIAVLARELLAKVELDTMSPAARDCVLLCVVKLSEATTPSPVLDATRVWLREEVTMG